MPRLRLLRNAASCRNNNNEPELDNITEGNENTDSTVEMVAVDPFEFHDDEEPKGKKATPPPTDPDPSESEDQPTEPIVLPRRGRPPKIPENLLELFKDADEVPGIGPKPIIRLTADHDTPPVSGKKKRLTVTSAGKRKLDTGNVKCELCERTFSNVSGYKRHLKACADSRAPPLVVKVQKIPLEEAVANGEIDQDEMDSALGISTDYSSDRGVAQEIIVSALEGACPCCGEDASTAHKEGVMKCPDCVKRFNSEQALERHRSIVHRGEKSTKKRKSAFNCSECAFEASTKAQLNKHLANHTSGPAGGKVYTCKQCNKHFNRKYHLDRHIVQMGCDGRPKATFPCEVCGKTFSRKDNLREHLRGHEGQVKRKRKLACEHCQKEFYGLSMLQIHIRTHTGEKPFNCEQCDKAFVSNNALSKHMRTHSGERPFACQDCGARFAAKETLNRHVKIHTGEKPHVCDFCGKGFIQPSQLKAHLFHHNGEHGFICEQCGKSFNRRTRLTLHIKYVHQGAEPFSCERCRKTFIRKEDLSRHEMLHAGVKPHECEICHKRFTIKSALKTHLLTHTREAPTMCDECGRAFIRQDCLLRHMRLKHRDVLEQIMADAEKRKLQQQLTAVRNMSSKPVSEDSLREHSTLAENISELLTVLVDEKTLRSFNWPAEDVGSVLESVIKRCGHEPILPEQQLEPENRLRENAKLLFTAVIDDAAVKTLLNNQSVDDVILHVLRLAKS